MAVFIAWKPHYSVGDTSLDSQHMIILGLINELYAAVSSNQEQSNLKSIVERLMNYTITHFQHEERIMLEHDYPDLHNHKQQHENLRRQTMALCENLNLVTGRDMLRFLKDWWVGHIQEQDKAYSPYLRAALVSRSAQ